MEVARDLGVRISSISSFSRVELMQQRSPNRLVRRTSRIHKTCRPSRSAQMRHQPFRSGTKPLRELLTTPRAHRTTPVPGLSGQTTASVAGYATRRFLSTAPEGTLQCERHRPFGRCRCPFLGNRLLRVIRGRVEYPLPRSHPPQRATEHLRPSLLRSCSNHRGSTEPCDDLARNSPMRSMPRACAVYPARSSSIGPYPPLASPLARSPARVRVQRPWLWSTDALDDAPLFAQCLPIRALVESPR